MYKSVNIHSAQELEVFFKANKKAICTINATEMSGAKRLGFLTSKLAIFYTKKGEYKFLNAPFVVVMR